MRRCIGVVWSLCVALSILICLGFILSQRGSPPPHVVLPPPSLIPQYHHGSGHAPHLDRIVFASTPGGRPALSPYPPGSVPLTKAHNSTLAYQPSERPSADPPTGAASPPPADGGYSYVSVGRRTGAALLEYYRAVRADRAAVLRRIVNPHPYAYLSNSAGACAPAAGEGVFLLALVPSAVTHHARRTLIRSTWAQPHLYALNVRVVFLLGRPEHDPAAFIQGAVLQEQALHRDLVQEEFIDTYDNLTLKTVAGLRWVARYCAHARYVLKIDDHVFVNLFTVLNELVAMPYYASYIIGNARFTDSVLRSGRWGVSESEWGLSMYPVFVVGPAYILSTDLALSLYRASVHVPFFRLEDVYTTGFVALLVDPPLPRYVQWEGRYCMYDPCLAEFTTPWGRGRYVYAHLEGTERYAAVWARVVAQDRAAHAHACAASMADSLNVFYDPRMYNLNVSVSLAGGSAEGAGSATATADFAAADAAARHGGVGDMQRKAAAAWLLNSARHIAMGGAKGDKAPGQAHSVESSNRAAGQGSAPQVRSWPAGRSSEEAVPLKGNALRVQGQQSAAAGTAGSTPAAAAANASNADATNAPDADAAAAAAPQRSNKNAGHDSVKEARRGTRGYAVREHRSALDAGHRARDVTHNSKKALVHSPRSRKLLPDDVAGRTQGQTGEGPGRVSGPEAEGPGQGSGPAAEGPVQGSVPRAEGPGQGSRPGAEGLGQGSGPGPHGLGQGSVASAAGPTAVDAGPLPPVTDEGLKYVGQSNNSTLTARRRRRRRRRV